MKTAYTCDYCGFTTNDLNEMKEHEMNCECEKEAKDMLFYILDDTELEIKETIEKVGIEKFLEWFVEWMEDSEDSFISKFDAKDMLTKPLHLKHDIVPIHVEFEDDDFESCLKRITGIYISKNTMRD